MLKFVPACVALLFPAVLSAGEGAVSFQRDIAPVLQRRCVNCHNEENSKGGYRIDTFAFLQKPGDSGAVPVTPGKTTESELHRLIVAEDSGERMPQKADALPNAESALIRRWIDEGAPFDGSDPDRPLAELVRDVHIRPAPSRYARPIPVTALAFNPDGRRLAVSGYREVLIWNLADARLVKRVSGMPERITSLAWEPKSDVIAVAGGTPGQWGTVALIEAGNEYRRRFLCDLPELALDLLFTTDGRALVAACGDRTLRVFEPGTGKQSRVLRLHADWVQSLALNQGGTRLATVSRDRTARVLATSDWHQVATYQGHDQPLLAAAFLPDDTRVFTSERGELHQWHPESGARRGNPGRVADARKLARGPFGIAAGCADGALRLFQAHGQDAWLTVREHRESVHALAVSQDGTLLASGSADGEVIVWSPSCWTPVLRFPAMP